MGFDGGRLSRRRLLQSGAAVAAAHWIPSFRLEGAAAATGGCVTPPSFPSHVVLYRQGYENWAKSRKIDDLWTCAPRNPGEIVTLANWAHRHGWRLRPRGKMHAWSPLMVTDDTDCETKVILLDTTQHLNWIKVRSTDPGEVRVGTGTTVTALATELEQHDLGFTALPAIGEITVGGGLAIGMHGANMPAVGEHRPPGHSYGTLSNMLIDFTAVVWSRKKGRYFLRRFHRSHPDSAAFLVHLGRAFITDATFRVGSNQNLRCVSRTDIPAAELFGPDRDGGRTFARYVNSFGRAEAIWFPFTEKPWFKTWEVAPNKPASSREVTEPYNYPFSDNIPEPMTDLITTIVSGNPEQTPALGQMEYEVTDRGLDATGSRDIWGKSKNTLLYIQPTTLRLDDQGVAIITNRANLQRVVHSFTSFYSRALDEERAKGNYPINGPLQFRATGVDRKGPVGVRGARQSPLSAGVPRRDHRDWNIVIYFNSLTIPGTPGEYAFFRRLESFARTEFSGFAAVRPEWSKNWGHSDQASWDDPAWLTDYIPNGLAAGRRPTEDWNWARRRLNHYDPHRVFSNGFLDRLLP